MDKVQILFYFSLIFGYNSAQNLSLENPNNLVNKLNFGKWLLTGCRGTESCVYNYREVEYEGYDGWYNNFARPDSGAVDKPLLRRNAAAYEDGSYKPFNTNRPNPLEVSEKILQGTIGSRSRTGKNALLVFFGQQVVEEILDAQRPACPPEYFNIDVPEDHIYRKTTPQHSVLPFLRTRYDQSTGYSPNNPRQQLNEITPYLDGGLMYGISKQWADELRTYNNGTLDNNGRLASTYNGRFPDYNTHRLPMANPPPPFYHAKMINDHELFHVSRFFKLGNPRGNENSFLLTFGVLWFRWHNYLAESIKMLQPEWSSEKIFNEARKWVIASQQRIVIEEWLPMWLNKKLPPYKSYDPSIDPQIDQFFQAAAFRFGHTLVTPGVYIRDYVRNNCSTEFINWKQKAVRTCNSFWRPQEVLMTKANNNDDIIDIDRLLMGMSVQLCEEEDHKIVEDLRQNVFGPLEFPRRDLMAVNIQRGRDHGISDYNTVRKIMNLEPLTDFDSFHTRFGVSEEVVKNLKDLYKNINNIDLWVGGILETDDGPGELFKRIIYDQFRRIRDGDRFWYENKQNNLFNSDEILRIKNLSLYNIILSVTNMSENDIPLNVFQVPKVANEVRCPNLIKSTCGFKNQNQTDCYHLPQLNVGLLKESCVQGNSYDYFSNSPLSFILSFTMIATLIIGTIGFVFILRVWKAKENLKQHVTNEKKIRTSFKTKYNSDTPLFSAYEWLGKYTQSRPVVILFNSNKKIEIQSQIGNKLRILDLSYSNCELKIYLISNDCYILLRNKNHYDLMLRFESEYLREIFHVKLSSYLKEHGIKEEMNTSWTTKFALEEAVTKEKRQQKLEMFFRVVFAQAFGIKHSQKEILNLDASTAKEIANMELTLNEFAEVLNMRPDSEFVVKMFQLIDKTRSNFISFREFVDLLVIFANGNADQKLKLLFDMYDINAVGYLTYEDFVAMIKSFLETVGGKIDYAILKETIDTMMLSAGLMHKKNLYFQDFKRIVGKDADKLDRAQLGFKGLADDSYLNQARNTFETIYASVDEIAQRVKGDVHNRNNSQELPLKHQHTEEKKKKKYALINYIERKSIHLFWYILYTLVLLAIFAERAYYYSVEREHTGLRRIAGYGVTITRGAASAMMFTYSSLLITMCRNTFTILRETCLSKFFPFDSMVDFHKYIAYCALAFTGLHVIGHAFNFYHISTQTADDLTCLFRNYFHSTHELPKFHYWCWQTITGFTGVLLSLLTAIIFIFAQAPVRRSLYNWFWDTHSLYPIFFILLFLHGAGRLVQEPLFYYFFLGPAIVFIIDKLISISRKKVIIPVLKAVILPSDVTLLECRRPDNFEYKSGQWVRIACIDLNSNEYHPFTLTSSPEERNLTLHIRAVGPWTRNIRKLYDNTLLLDKPLPVIYLDGPYGEGHQNWNKHDVTVLIGGGIGVTPFASILKDIVFKVNSNNNKILQKKVYFIWISRTQKQFEWLVDILRHVEEKDVAKVVTTHIYITQFYEKFDIRTILLYICETHYQKISNKSLFTNLEAVTHFGRPKFQAFFSTLQTIHSNCGSIGVFSCGPPSMTDAIESACADLNKEGIPYFEHSYKNY